MADTSWESVGFWYQNLVGEQGHYYHRNVILPKLLNLFELDKTKDPSILDLACGQGILSCYLPKHIQYTGVDAAPSLVQFAKKNNKGKQSEFIHADVTKKIPLPHEHFSHALIMLALQNMAQPEQAIKNAALHLKKNGTLVIVLNHPCFRIPRQSSWGVEEAKQLQYRRIDRYMTPMEIPIQMQPGKGKSSASTVSFHHPLSSFVEWLSQNGFYIDKMEEWVSDKTSTGSKARMENRARKEFPLFMTIRAKKIA